MARKQMIAVLRCMGCGTHEPAQTADFRCVKCGELLEAVYPAWQQNGGKQKPLNPSALKKAWLQRRTSLDPLDQSGVWRFRELLPILSNLGNAVTLAEGNTPLYKLQQSAKQSGIEQLFVKHLGMNPTGSFKDTGMTTVISKAHELGVKWVACASTGNTSSSMAAYAARAGLKCLVLVPQDKISVGKLSQTLEYGAIVCQLPTDFDGCLQILSEVVQQASIYLVNSANPYRLEGQKTAAIEMLEQLGWSVPDHVIVPGGNLGNSSAIGKGLLELHELGFIPHLPKVSVIQAEGSRALVRTMQERNGESLVSVKAETLATAIRIGSPVSWRKAVNVLRATSGACEYVTEQEIAAAKAQIGAEGIGCEPASAVTLAGLYKLRKQDFVKSGETVVLMLTGHVLKDADYIIRFHSGQLLPEASEAMKSFCNPPVKADANPKSVLEVLDRFAHQPTGALA
jgi:threonine synthase